MKYGYVDSPVGELLVLRDDTGLRGLYFPDHVRGPQHDPQWERDDEAMTDVRAQLAEYFTGTRRAFDLPLSPSGTAFQERVWKGLVELPYGTTTTYGALATAIGAPGSARAVGPAVGRNPLSILIPCHRVLGSTGALTGFAGGLTAKRALLDLEAGTPRL